MRALSPGSRRSTSVPAACSTSLKFDSMLRLRSSIMTSVIGWRSAVNVVIGWSLPLS